MFYESRVSVVESRDERKKVWGIIGELARFWSTAAFWFRRVVFLLVFLACDRLRWLGTG